MNSVISWAGGEKALRDMRFSKELHLFYSLLDMTIGDVDVIIGLNIELVLIGESGLPTG